MAELRGSDKFTALGHANQVEQARKLLEAGWSKFLFVGEEGIGKRKVAQNLCRELNCLSQGNIDCTCVSCRRMRSGSGILIMDFENTEERKTDRVRELLQDSKRNSPGIKRKCIILDNVDYLPPKTEDLFLKDLEERKEVVYFVVARLETNVRNTIASRLLKLEFQGLSVEDFNEIIWGLPEVAGMGMEQVELAASLSGRSVSKFRKFISSHNLELYRLIEMSWGDQKNVLKIMNNLRNTKDKQELKEKVQFMLQYIKVKMFERAFRDLRGEKNKFFRFVKNLSKYERLADWITARAGKSYFYVEMILRYWMLELFEVK